MKIMNKFNWFILGFCFLFMFFLCKPIKVGALKYEYTSGIVEVKHKDVKVNSFEYDYVTKFDEGEVLDGEEDITNKTFYSGRSIGLNYSHYSHWWPFTNDKDKTEIYKYNNDEKNFNSLITSFVDKKGTYEVTDEGLYKIVYLFEGKIRNVTYINIRKELHNFMVVSDSRYEDIPAFSKFSFTLKMEDAYDLKDNSYYYAFGSDPLSLSYTRFSVFTEEEINRNDKINSFDREVFVDINDSDVGEDKYLFIKVALSDGSEQILKTESNYSLSTKLIAGIYITDDNGQIIRDKRYYKYGDEINFKIRFNGKVMYEDLLFTIDGNNYTKLDDTSSYLNEIAFKLVVDSIKDFEGAFNLKTKNNISAIVVCEGSNVTLNVMSFAVFAIDVTKPTIEFLEEVDGVAKKEYLVPISIIDNNIDQIYYYANKCSIVDENLCLDTFDSANINVRTLAKDEDVILKIDNSFGVFDGENLALFIKIVDMAGNVEEKVYYNYVIDNVIIPREENLISNLVDLKVDEEVIGKELVVQVPRKYNIEKIEYHWNENNQGICQSDGIYYDDILKFKCMEVKNYDFKAVVTIDLFDYFGNVESRNVNFRYSTINTGTVLINEREFDLYNDKDYDLEYKTYNYMTSQASGIFLDRFALQRFKEELHLNELSIEDLTINLIYLDGENKIVLVNNIIDSIQIPSILVVVETLSYLDKFKSCAINKCDVEIYLEYLYTINQTNQSRLIKFNFIDKTNKFYVEDDFVYNFKLDINQSFEGPTFTYLDNSLVGINESNVDVFERITFKDLQGNLQEVQSVNSSTLGEYTITKTFMCDGISSFPLNLIVEIADLSSPVIRLIGKEKIVLNEGDKFEDPFVVANDNYDKELVIQTSINPELDLNKTGKYVISYWCEDSSGNKSEVITRIVEVVPKEGLKTYLVSGSIVLVTISIVIFFSIIERKKEKKKNSR